MPRATLATVLAAVTWVIAVSALPAGAQSPPSPTAGTITPVPSGTPTVPPPSGTPLPSATPWPAPTNLRVTTETRLLGEGGIPLPPELQEHTDVLTWDHPSGFEGEYEVEVTLVPHGGGSPTILQAYMRFPASRGEGTIRRVSQYPEWLNNQRCYRIRATIPSGAGGIERGPFSAQACTVRAPSSGGDAPAPAAPAAGTGAPTPAPAPWTVALGALLIALGAGATAALSLSAPGRRR